MHSLATKINDYQNKMEDYPMAKKKKVTECLLMKDKKFQAHIDKTFKTRPVFLDEALCHIVSDLMEEVPFSDDHFFKKRDAIVQNDKLKELGWFNRNIDPMIEGFWNFVKIVSKGKVVEDREDGEPHIKKGPIFPGSLPTYQVYKLAHLNKSFQKRITDMFTPDGKVDIFKSYYLMLLSIKMLNAPPNFDKFHKLSLRQTVEMVGNKMTYKFVDENELSPYLKTFQ